MPIHSEDYDYSADTDNPSSSDYRVSAHDQDSIIIQDPMSDSEKTTEMTSSMGYVLYTSTIYIAVLGAIFLIIYLARKCYSKRENLSWQSSQVEPGSHIAINVQSDNPNENCKQPETKLYKRTFQRAYAKLPQFEKHQIYPTRYY